MKRLIPLLLALLLVLPACGRTPAEPRAITVGLALPAAGDSSRTTAEAAEGALRALAESDGTVTLVTEEAGESGLSSAIQTLTGRADLVLTVGESSAAALSLRARSALETHPGTAFVLLDGLGIQGENVTCYSFAMEEAAFLAGFAAARATDTGPVGYLQTAGTDGEPCAAGFIAGVRAVSSQARILQLRPGNGTGETDAAVVDLVQKGADVIFCAAREGTSELITACAREGVWAETVATDESDLAESAVLAVAVKDMGFAAENAARRCAQGTLARGSFTLDLEAGGVRLAVREGILTEKATAALSQVTSAIESGARTVPADLAALEELYPGAYTLN